MQTVANSFSRSSGLAIDGERAAYRAHVAGRRIGYLDTDAWIRLGRDRDEIAGRCRRLCESGVRQKRLIFPLSYAACSELVQQAPSPSRDARVNLMQSLSEGVAFRDRDTVRRIEAEAVVPLVLGDRAAEVDMSRLFAGVQECLSDFADCDLVETPVSPEILSRARHTNLFRSLAQYVHICDGLNKYEESGPFFEPRREILSASVTKAANAVRDPNGKVNRARALRQEAVGAFMNALPALRAAFEARPQEDQRRLAELARHDPGSPERLIEFIRSMPSVTTETELFTRRVIQPERKHRGRNDFWDIEHAIVPATYSDVWVTLDQGLAALVRSCETPRRRGCVVLASMGAFCAWLQEHG